MRILFVCGDLGIPVLGGKGASAHVRALATALAGTGHEVAVAAGSLVRSPWERPAAVDVPVVHLPPSERTTATFAALKARGAVLGAAGPVAGEVRRILYDDELLAQLRARVAHERPDVVYERASLHTTAGARLAEELEVPYIVEVNAPLALEQATYRGNGLAAFAAAAERRTLRAAGAVVAVSAALSDYVVSLGVEPAKVSVLPNGVDPERFRPSPVDGRTRQRLGLDGAPVLGFVGGLRPWHGVDALPGLLRRLDRARLVVVGDGPLRASLDQRLRDYGVRDRVVFTGLIPHEEVPDVVRALDVALAPYEPLDHPFYFSPLKLFEAMACGVPVVAARIGQIEEVVEDGQTGLLYRPGDEDALAGACERLLADEDLRARIGAAAATAVRVRYTWRANAERIVQLAESLRR